MNIEHVGRRCCSCKNCETICPVDAIKFKKDEYGFDYPEINHEKCIDCGRCFSICPVFNPVGTKEEVYDSGVAYSLDNDTKYNGSSGGLFGTFAKEIIYQDGIVFGAAFDSNLKLKTTYAETIEELISLYKSKYLLCDTNNEFVHIKKELANGRKVLYCATPCQIHALKLYLNKDYPNLYLIDFVCHGVGSQDTLDRSIAYSEKKLNARIKKIIFRYKGGRLASHHYYYFYCENENKKFKKKDLYLSFPYYNAYCKQLACRDNCYKCVYATRNRVSDITIGDFHGINKYDQKIDSYAGTSMFLCNTKKGKELFDLVKKDLYAKSMDVEILYENNRFSNNGYIPEGRKQFIESLSQDSFDVTVQKFLKPSKDWKRMIYYNSPTFLRRIAKKFMGE